MAETAHAVEVTRRARWTSCTWEVAVAAFGVCVCTSGLSIFASQHVFHVPPVWTTWTFAYPFTAVGVLGVVLLGRELRARALRDVPWPLVAAATFVAIALVSATWSVSAAATPHAALLDIGIVAFGAWLGLALDTRQLILAVSIGMAVPVLASLPLIAFRPEYARAPVPYVGASYGGEWNGMFANRNSLAAVSLLGGVAALGLVVASRTWWGRAGGLVLGGVHAVVLYFTDSDTSMIAAAICVVAAAAVPVLWWLRRCRMPGPVVVGVGVAGVVVGWVVLFANLTELARKVGRDPTLSNRRTIWSDVRGFIADRPWQGYGYWGLWERPDLTAASYARVGKQYGSAHNSVLEVVLGLGVIGLVVYLVICVASVSGVLRWTWRERGVESWWWTVLVVYLVAENLTESFVLWHSYNLMLVVASTMVPFGAALRRRSGTTSI
jgi:exopolysaccharide production protein ExoQ